MPGQYVDLETGLYQNWWRDYDPALGRYMQADQIRLAGGANLYGYAGANPVSYIDPEGQHPILWLGHLGGVGAAGGWALWDIINGCPIDYEGAFNAGMTAFDVMTLGAGSHVSLGVKALQGVGRNAAGSGAVKNSGNGLESRGIRPAPGTRARPEGIPKNWRVRPTRTKGGVEFYNPKNTIESVRVMQGKPNSICTNSQTPCARQRLASGKFLDAEGNSVSKKDGAGRIPLNDFKFRECYMIDKKMLAESLEELAEKTTQERL